jgi:FtsH-binding integral membrane protein
MADYDNRALNTTAADAGVMDAGLRAYMIRIYNYMLVGLGLTGVFAFGTYALSFTTDPAQAAATMRDGTMVTQLGVLLFGSPLRWIVMLAPLGLVFFLSFRIHKMSVGAAQSTFWIYAALMGVSLASIFLVYTGASITQTFFVSAATFGAMSLYGYTTKRDLTGWGSFLFMGLIGLLIAVVVNIFLQSSALQFVISAAGVLIFTGLTAYDTQKIKEIYYVGDDSTVAGRKSIMGALTLYLDFINLFLMLLRLIGDRR